jgi:sortase A
MKRVVVIILILLLGIGLLAYPTVSNYLTQINGSTAIQTFTQEVASENTEELEKQRSLAEEYNKSLSGQNIKDPFVPGSGVVFQGNYNEILNYANNMMGYIEIPKISVYLPIYHGTSDEVLAKGIGHMSETAFPIGGDGNHAVLTGHTGLPSAKLFTDLTELKEEDIFYIHILGGTLAYQVDQIKIVEPEDTRDLLPVQGKDYVTLITCTPYGVNTQRLLVRGTRVPYEEQKHQEQVDNESVVVGVDFKMALRGAIIAGALLVIVIVILLVVRHQKKRKGDGVRHIDG